MQSSCRNWLLPLLTGLLCGCFSLPERSYPDKHQFSLSAPRLAPSRQRDGRPDLAISEFEVASPYDRSGFTYRLSDSEFSEDFYHEFFAPAGGMITEQARLWLQQSGIFGAVVHGRSGARPKYALSGRVTELYGDDRETPAARLGIEFSLLHRDRSESRIILQRRYTEVVPLPAMAATELADGWNRALARILARFEADLAALELSSDSS